MYNSIGFYVFVVDPDTESMPVAKALAKAYDLSTYFFCLAVQKLSNKTIGTSAVSVSRLPSCATTVVKSPKLYFENVCNFPAFSRIS